MKQLKKFVEAYFILFIYIGLTSYLLVQKTIGQLTVGDLQLFLLLSIVCLTLGFFSFFNFERYIQIAGMIMMIFTVLATALMLFI